MGIEGVGVVDCGDEEIPLSVGLKYMNAGKQFSTSHSFDLRKTHSNIQLLPLRDTMIVTVVTISSLPMMRTAR